MKILIVDDQPMMLRTLEIKFVKEGYEVLTTTKAAEALHYIASENIDVVISEVLFAESTEFAILKAAKNKDYNIVVIIVSIHSNEQIIIDAFEKGAEEYLVKPVNLNLLSVRIKKLLKVRKMREVLAKSIPPTERQNILRQLSNLEVSYSSNQPLPEIKPAIVPERNIPVSGSALLRGPNKPVIPVSKPKPAPVPKKEIYPDYEKEDDDTESENYSPTSKNIQNKIARCFKEYVSYFLLLTLFFIAARFFEIIADSAMHGSAKLLGATIADGLAKDLLFSLHVGLILFIPFLLFYFISRNFAKIFFIVTTIILVIIQIGLSQYFLTTLVPLGADLWSYSVADVKQTVQASGGIKGSMIFVFLLAVGLIIISFIFLPKKLRVSNIAAGILALILFLSIFIDNSFANRSLMPGKEYSNNLSINKSWYFYNSSWLHFFPPSNKDIYAIAPAAPHTDTAKTTADGLPPFNYIDPQNFPFLHTIDTNRNVLSPFFDSAKTPPNIVIILVEGLGRAFTNKNAYLGNFTPFLDSLSEKSLYWENFLSEGGRTFAVLPSVLGSLPFNKTGFNELGNQMSPHVSLLSILKRNGYNTSFYYGGDSHFDNMDIYLKKNEVNNIYDEGTYPASYVKMPPSASGFSWGYGDKELFRRYFETKQNVAAPFASVLLTVSTHSPFIVNNEPEYQQRFETRLTELKFDEPKKTEARNYKDQYASILFMDDAIRGFINQYAKRPDFNNTIFIITGDHRMPEIPMSTKIDRYHVPLIIFSPMMKHPNTFSSISTHFDITPSLTLLLHKTYGLSIPTMAQWMGAGLDTNRSFRNLHTYPFKQTKNEGINDFMSGEYLMNENNLFRIFKSMDIEPESNPAKTSEMNAALEDFKKKNDQFIQTGKLIPDSLAKKWGSK